MRRDVHVVVRAIMRAHPLENSVDAPVCIRNVHDLKKRSSFRRWHRRYSKGSDMSFTLPELEFASPMRMLVACTTLDT